MKNNMKFEEAIELLEKSRMSIQLYGNEGYNPDIKWLTNAEGEGGDICLFRSKVYGSEGMASLILGHFGTDDADLEAIFGSTPFKKSYENVTVTTLTKDEHKLIKIRFDKTV